MRLRVTIFHRYTTMDAIRAQPALGTRFNIYHRFNLIIGYVAFPHKRIMRILADNIIHSSSDDLIDFKPLSIKKLGYPMDYFSI